MIICAEAERPKMRRLTPVIVFIYRNFRAEAKRATEDDLSSIVTTTLILSAVL